jgi:hypothetical protein
MYLLKSPIQPGDLVVRPAKFGLFNHYGTGLSSGMIAHTTPGPGKHIGTLGEFADGQPVAVLRPVRTTLENAMVEQRAVSNLGKPYALADNCEHDASFAQTGVPGSGTLKGALILGGLFALAKIVSD